MQKEIFSLCNGCSNSSRFMNYVMVFTILQVLLSVLLTYGQAIIIQTPIGSIKGSTEDVPNVGSIFKFLKIPYAKPPLGNRRFMKPEPYGSWNNVLDATQYGPSCMQNIPNGAKFLLSNTEVDENCLFLNIYVPYDTNSTSKKTVMVWIHGGGYIHGQGMLYDPTSLAMTGNVVVVTFNYRLGVYGFFYTGDSNSLGNYGLWDQKLALEWIKNNIEEFGGNPNSITIFGESAGGWSVSILALNPKTKGLYHRVIAQSGVANAALALYPPSHMISIGKTITQKLGCGSEWSNTFDVVQCMKNVTADKLLENNVLMTPTVDGDFITDLPEKLIANKTSESYLFFRSLDFIIGNTYNEGNAIMSSLNKSFLESVYNFSFVDGVPLSAFCEDIMPKVADILLLNSEKIKNAMCEMYTNQSSIAVQGKKVTEFLGDAHFLIPSIKMLNAHTSVRGTGKTFMYLFARTHVLIKTLLQRYNWLDKAGHGDEVVYLFGLDKIAEKFGVPLSQDEISFIRQFLEYWTNFAKTGNPNAANLTSWGEYNPSGKKYLYFGEDGITEDASVFPDRVKFWIETIPSLQKSKKEQPMSGTVVGQQTPSCITYILISIIVFVFQKLYGI